MKQARAAGKPGKGALAGQSGDAGKPSRAGKKGEAGKSGDAGKQAKKNEAGRSRLRSRHVARAVTLLMFAICIAALYERGGAVEWLLVIVVGAIVFGSMILPYMTVGKISVERSVSEASQLTDGGELQVTLTLRLSGLLPFMWVSVREELARIGEQTGKAGNAGNAGNEKAGQVIRARAPGVSVLVQHAFLPGFARQFQLSYTVKGLTRGEMLFQPVHVSVGDMLGLTVRGFAIDCSPGTVLVKAAPPLGETFVNLPGHRPGVQTTGEHLVVSLGGQMQTLAARFGRHGAGPDVRSYMPGDPLGRVDWRAMARGLGLQTRTSNAEYSTELIILLETSEQAYGGDIRLFDAHVGRAAQLIKQAHQEGKSVLLLKNTADDLGLQVDAGDRVAARRAEEQLARLGWGRSESMSLRLSDAVASLTRGSALICLTAGELQGDSTSEAGMIMYSAKLAAVRGVQLYVLLSEARDMLPEYAEQKWRERLQGAKCKVRAMPVPLSYRGMVPGVTELTMTTGREGGVIDVGSARS
ncbi:uncharacterized protein (DUF58 family) [Paenibacillus taihuensis]|uniref:Uncharacterized protein (DUF58 family) n=1 Tax=Paenibacillus taihuensis TaxID=1156355 RepID=A0A3D9SBA8_9BACL|nr:DUF58 domain-containing protein [Paenibacillus taihuensis]REE90570.1 uncharacterized protein (DUF58 family) [Paenibacillus taihuensis]